MIQRGGVVAIPTDTLYGLAANPFLPRAAERIFRIKRRAESKPILLLIDSMEQLEGLVCRPPRALQEIAARFWPGPLTVILRASGSVPPAITAGTGTVAVRWPARRSPPPAPISPAGALP
jgi:L-threonylcarbamoyladenylate synthase